MKSVVPVAKGTAAALLILLNTLIFFPFLLIAAFLKLLIPMRGFRRLCTVILDGIARYWIGFNNTLTNLFHDIEWQVEGAENLSRSDWYFVTCNHQSWADIPVIQHALNSRIPLLKFFLKKELIWVPFLGVAWWALDFPFMQRYTKEEIKKNPALKGKDLETTRAACEKFRHTPVTIFNFMEGTRFTPAKHQAQSSPYKHLLKPRAGGTGFVFGAMGDMLHQFLDVTIVYPDRQHGFWDYLCGRIKRVVIHIRTVEIPEQFLGMNYVENNDIKREFQQWVSNIWHEKDERIDRLMSQEGM